MCVYLHTKQRSEIRSQVEMHAETLSNVRCELMYLELLTCGSPEMHVNAKYEQGPRVDYAVFVCVACEDVNRAVLIC